MTPSNDVTPSNDARRANLYRLVRSLIQITAVKRSVINHTLTAQNVYYIRNGIGSRMRPRACKYNNSFQRIPFDYRRCINFAYRARFNMPVRKCKFVITRRLSPIVTCQRRISQTHLRRPEEKRGFISSPSAGNSNTISPHQTTILYIRADRNANSIAIHSICLSAFYIFVFLLMHLNVRYIRLETQN